MNKRTWKVAQRNTRRGKVLIIVALLVGVVAISIGFAAYTNVLEIEEEVIVKPDASLFKVTFSSSDTEIITEAITPTKSDKEILTSSAIITNGDISTVSNLSATFTEPNQSVTYKLYAHNVGKYEAFLKEIMYNNLSNSTTYKKCSALPGVTINENLMDAACDDMKITVKVGEDTFNETNHNITSHVLTHETSEPIEIKLEYLDNHHYVDGDFKVELGSISLKYSSLN